MFAQNISEKTQEKIYLMVTITTRKGRESLSRLLQSPKSGWKKQKKSCERTREEYISEFNRNNTTFQNYINGKKKLRLSIPDLYIHEKADGQMENDFEKVEVLKKIFSSVFVEDLNWTWMFKEEERPYIKHYLSINITKEDLQKRL